MGRQIQAAPGARHLVGAPSWAQAAIETARQRLLERASHIDNPGWHRCFLYDVPEHARTLQLYEEWTLAGDSNAKA